ncbi:MAG: DUF4136 domain-containing protein, partial [Bacteroidota bacterium]|nr:DUF4136 domain-containing protein [Bacteroidota bacterium]
FKRSLNEYNTYAWSSDINKIPSSKIFIGDNGVVVFNNESLREKIKEAIGFELSAKGYKKDESKPELLVMFRVTEQPGTLTTYNGYQTIDGFDKVRTPEDVQHTKIAAGTLIINLLDGKSGKVAWQGYASGILKPNMINDKMKVREAVSDIFQKFHFKAKQ